MKIISDIRLYRSTHPNADGNPLPDGGVCRTLCLTAQRIVMKLREKGFSLGEFTHLYINFTTCLSAGEICAAARSVDAYHPWYRYYDVGVSGEEYALLASSMGSEIAVRGIRRVLKECFATDEEQKTLIDEAVSEAVEQGEAMLMRFKEKKSAKASAVIFLRLRDDGWYHPLLCVQDAQGNEILRRDLPPTRDFLPLGEIQLGAKRVTVKPRRNAPAQELKIESVSFEL